MNLQQIPCPCIECILIPVCKNKIYEYYGRYFLVLCKDVYTWVNSSMDGKYYNSRRQVFNALKIDGKHLNDDVIFTYRFKLTMSKFY